MDQHLSKSHEDGKQSNHFIRTVLTVVMSWLLVSSLFFAIESWSTTARFSDTGLPTLVAIHAFIAVFKLLLLIYSIYGIIAVISGSETMLEVLFYITLIISMIGFIVLLGTTIPCSIDAAKCDYKSHFANISISSIGDFFAHLESRGFIEKGRTAQAAPLMIQTFKDNAEKNIPPLIVEMFAHMIDQLKSSVFFRAKSMAEKEQWVNVRQNFQCCENEEPGIFPISMVSSDCPAKGRDWFMFVLARDYGGCFKLAEFRDRDGRYSLICDLITLLAIISSMLFYYLKNNRI